MDYKKYWTKVNDYKWKSKYPWSVSNGMFASGNLVVEIERQSAGSPVPYIVTLYSAHREVISSTGTFSEKESFNYAMEFMKETIIDKNGERKY